MDNITLNLHAACRMSASRHAKLRIVIFGRNFADVSRKKASNVRYRNGYAEIKTKSLQNLAYTSSEDNSTIMHASLAPNSPDVYNHVVINSDERVCKMTATNYPISNCSRKYVHAEFQPTCLTLPLKFDLLQISQCRHLGDI